MCQHKKCRIMYTTQGVALFEAPTNSAEKAFLEHCAGIAGQGPPLPAGHFVALWRQITTHHLPAGELRCVEFMLLNSVPFKNFSA